MTPETNRNQKPELLGAFFAGVGHNGAEGELCLITRVDAATVDYLCSELLTRLTRDALGMPLESRRRVFYVGNCSIAGLPHLLTALDVEVEHPALLADWARITEPIRLRKAKEAFAGNALAA